MAGRSLLCPRCGTPLWGNGGTPSPAAGSDAVEVVCPGCGASSSVVVMTRIPESDARDEGEVAADLERARQLRLAEAREALAGGGFTSYGLSAGWTGCRWINGWRSDRSADDTTDVLRSVTLVFGLPFETDDGPTPAWAEIETHRYPSGGHAEADRMAAARSLAFEAWQSGADLGPVQLTYRGDGDLTAHWELVELAVADRTVPMRRLAHADQWWAVGLVDGDTVVSLKVRGLSLAQCRLVEVADYTPFLGYRPLLG